MMQLLKFETTAHGYVSLAHNNQKKSLSFAIF
jgi:hypothetical protein